MNARELPKDELDRILVRNEQSFSRFGTFCGACMAFGVGRNPQTGQHGLPVTWTAYSTTRKEAELVMQATIDHPIRKQHPVILLVQPDDRIVFYALCEECAVKEGVSCSDEAANN